MNEAASATAPLASPPVVPAPVEGGDLAWRLLQILNLFRVIAGGLAVLIFLGGQPRILGNLNAALFFWTGVGYFCFGALASLPVRAQRPPLLWQVCGQILADIAAITLLMHASGGAGSGIGGLLFISIAVNSVILSRRLSIAFAALATLVLLGEQTFVIFQGYADTSSYTQTGILGLILFAAAIGGHRVGRWLKDSQALAAQRGVDLRNLTQLNEYIIRRMRTGVIVVDTGGQVRLANDAALQNFDAEGTRPADLAVLSPRLQQEWEAWQREPRWQPGGFTTENGKAAVLHFMQLAGGTQAGTLIFLEDPELVAEQVRQMKLATLGRLTASIAHEIRNPLAAISHANQLLGESPRLDSEDRRLGEIIREHAKRMEHIVETVMQLSRRETSRAAELELVRWLKDFVTEFRDRQSLTGADLAVRIETGDSVRVRVHPGHIYQVVWNLCENALHHGQSSGSGPPLIELRIAPLPEAGAVELTVMDRGPGVPADIAKHMFEPFYTSSPRGTGLGLFISHELCEVNRAELSYEPREGGGSCFRIRFNTADNWLT